MPHGKNDREKRSWREIDRARESGSKGREDSSRAGRQDSSQAYRAYKTQLNKLFDGGAVPDALAGRLGEQGVGTDVKQRKQACERILVATTPGDVRQALAAHIETHGFPEDEAVLTKLLDLSDEQLVLRAIEALQALQSAGALKRGASLRARLQTACLTLDDPAVGAAANVLLKALR